MKKGIIFCILIGVFKFSAMNLCDAVITTYNGPIAGNKTISECVNGSRKSYSDLEISTSELTRKEGYPAEEHFVVTEDGYLLTVHRIPGAPGSPVVLMIHGVTQSSFDWVVTGKNNALAFLLHDQGYDVWMGNIRGNFYSRCHTTIDPSDRKFWDFSFHEMGLYDLPAEIRHIKNVTSQSKMIYVSHSMGANQFFVMASELPDFADDNIKAMFSLAPPIFNYHLRGIGSTLAPLSPPLTAINQLLMHGEVFSQNRLWKLFVKYVCELISRDVCEIFLFTVIGFDPDLIDFNKLPLFFNHFPMGASSKSTDHLSQSVRKNSFKHYDYGETENLRRYNSRTPPDYDLSKAQIPVGLFYGANDYLSNEEDVEHLWGYLSNKIIKYQVPFDKFNHFDFMWANKARELVYEKLVEEMKKF